MTKLMTGAAACALLLSTGAVAHAALLKTAPSKGAPAIGAPAPKAGASTQRSALQAPQRKGGNVALKIFTDVNEFWDDDWQEAEAVRRAKAAVAPSAAPGRR